MKGERDRWKTFVFLVTMFAGCAFSADAPAPELKLSACTKPPILDGVLDDACWKNAAAVTGFHVMGSDRTTAQKAWVTYDNQWVYLAFDVTHPRPDQMKPTALVRDSHVAGDDCVEVFLDPGTGGRLYYHFMLNVANVRAEQRMTVTEHGIQRQREWDIPWRSATRRTAAGWAAELAIPVVTLTDYGELAQSRMNLCIRTNIPKIDPYGIRVGETSEFFSWVPVIKSFHEPERFGALRGLAPARPSPPFLPAFRDARIGKYDLAAGQYSYPVSLSLRNYGPTRGTVSVVVRDQPVSGQEKDTSREILLEGNRKQSVEIPVPVETLSGRSVTVLLKDPATGEVLQSEPIPDTSTLVLLSAYADRNYYTTEKEALAVCSLGLPPAELKTRSLVVRNAEKTVLARMKSPGPEARLAVPLKTLTVGTHSLAVELLQEDGKPVFSQSLEILKQPVKPGCEWKIDRVNRAVLKDGAPAIVFGVIAGSCRDAYLKQLSDAGVRAIIPWDYILDREYPGRAGDFMTLERLLAALQKYNISFVDYLDGHDPGEGSLMRWKLKYMRPEGVRLPEGYPTYEAAYAKKMEVVRDAISKIKNSPLLIGYINIDEPPVNPWVEKASADYYRAAREIDGYRPVFFNCGIYDDYCDIIGADPYWVPASSDPRRGTPSAVVSYLYGFPYRNYVKDAAAMRRPIWMVPMGEYWSGCHKRAILPREQLCQTYLLLIHGVKGIFYFCHPFRHALSLATLGELTRQMETLGPIAASPDVPQAVKYNPGEMDPANNKMPDVHVVLKPNPAGGQVLLTANAKQYPVDVTFSVSSLGRAGSAGRLFSKDLYPVRNGSFTDTIEGYGVRAYTLPTVSGSDRPVDIQVNISPRQDAGSQEEIEVPRTGRVGKKNLVPNPSFEEAGLPGWPDYYRVNPSTRQMPFLGTPDAVNGQVGTDAWHGKYSVWLEANPVSVETFEQYPTTGANIVCYVAPKVDKPTYYVASAYLRAEKEGVKAKFICVGDVGYGPKTLGEKTFTLTRQWQRYSESGRVPAGLDEYNIVGVRFSGEGAVWVDGLQLEKGTEPTEFEP